MTDKKTATRELGLKEISEVLSSGNFDRFIGVRENEFFEAKSFKPYDLDNSNDADKTQAIAELSSDIAHFANQKGGYIVCGLDTPPVKDVPHDIVGSLRLGKKKGFYNETQIKGIIKASVYPKLDVEVAWYPSSSNQDSGSGVIYIPKQDEQRKYFIVRVCEADGKKFKGFLGIPIRKDDQKYWLPVQDVYKLSKRTPNKLHELAESISEQLQGIETRLSNKIESSSKELQPKTEDLLELKIEKALHE